MTTQSRSLRLADSLARNPRSWPGLYPQYAITDDGQPLCHTCVRSERKFIATTTGSDGWCVKALAINWQEPLNCAHCGHTIDSAYDRI